MVRDEMEEESAKGAESLAGLVWVQIAVRRKQTWAGARWQAFGRSMQRVHSSKENNGQRSRCSCCVVHDPVAE